VAFRSDEVGAVVNVGGNTSPETFQFAGNFWYCLDRPERTQRMVQLPTAEKEGVYGKDPQFHDAEKGDLSLKPESPARDVGPRQGE
jgi:hypothetical protein